VSVWLLQLCGGVDDHNNNNVDDSDVIADRGYFVGKYITRRLSYKSYGIGERQRY